MNYATALPRGDLSASVNKTLKNTFLAVGIMLALTAGTSYLSLGLRLGWMATLGLFGASLVAMFAAMACRNNGFGLVLLAAFSGIQGITLGPLLNHYLEMKGGTNIVVLAATLTAIATFACAAYAITTRRDFSRMGGFLMVGTLVILVATIVGLFVQMTMFHVVVSAAAALLFAAWILYDVGAVVSGQETNYISAALGIYLDILNLFVHILRLLGIAGGSDD